MPRVIPISWQPGWCSGYETEHCNRIARLIWTRYRSWMSVSPEIKSIQVKDCLEAFQLDRYVQTSALIKSKISKRRTRKANTGEHDWGLWLTKRLMAKRQSLTAGMLTQGKKRPRL